MTDPLDKLTARALLAELQEHIALDGRRALPVLERAMAQAAAMGPAAHLAERRKPLTMRECRARGAAGLVGQGPLWPLRPTDEEVPKLLDWIEGVGR
jgi:hypothetical protein